MKQPTQELPLHPPVPSLRDFEDSRSIPCPNNAELCLDVRLALLQVCPSIAFSIEIVAREGVVYLSGNVATDHKLVQMYKAARTVPGIRWICNDVTVLRAELARAFDSQDLAGMPLAA